MLKLRNKVLFLILLMVSFFLCSCVLLTEQGRNDLRKDSLSTTSYPYQNGEFVSTDNFGSPNTHTLVYGSLNYSAKDAPVYVRMEFIQIDPEKEAMVLTPYRREIKNKYKDGDRTRIDLFYFAPLKQDLTFQNIYKEVAVTPYTIFLIDIPIGYFNIPGIVFKTKKPGLQYIGNYDLSYDSMNKRNDAKAELYALRQLLDKVKETEWVPVIEARIKELTKWKKRF